jgi:hypothetical protein
VESIGFAVLLIGACVFFYFVEVWPDQAAKRPRPEDLVLLRRIYDGPAHPVVDIMPDGAVWVPWGPRHTRVYRRYRIEQDLLDGRRPVRFVAVEVTLFGEPSVREYKNGVLADARPGIW